METMSASENSPEEFRSRGYQDDLLQFCIRQNTIIYLPTGAGKTFIAIMALKHFSKDIQLPINEGGKRSIFLTNTVALAHQQKEAIERSTALRVAVYTGDMNVDAWRRDRWFGEFDENQVLVATVQIILDVIRHGYIKLSNLNLIIFDECHNATKDHPMFQMMNEFTKTQPPHPRVIGLTGMLTSPSVKEQNVEDELIRLENTFRAAIATVRGLDAYNEVMSFSTAPIESILEFELSISTNLKSFIFDRVDKIIKEINKWPIDRSHLKSSVLDNTDEGKRGKTPLKAMQTLWKDFQYQYTDLGVYGAHIALLALLVEIELKKRECETTIVKLLMRQQITHCEVFLHILKNAMDEDDDESDDERMDIEDEPAPDTLKAIDENAKKCRSKDSRTKILTNSSAKVQRMLLFLSEHVRQHGGNKMRALIFVQRRRTAKILSNIICRFAQATPTVDIRPEFMVGNNSTIPDSIESLLCNRSNRKVLDRFRTNELNLIVSTSVLEEGIDVQECNLVIAFDKPISFRAYVQSKGRARMVNSRYVIMSPIGQGQLIRNKLVEWTRINEKLKKCLVQRSIDRDLPDPKSVDKQFESLHNEVYSTGTANVDMNSSVSLVNRYCQTLPADQFTLSAVTWNQEQTKEGTVVRILLPIQSTINTEIIGKPKPTTKLAKRSAALNAIKELHQKGELNDHLLPINKKRLMENVHDIYFKHWNEFLVGDTGKPDRLDGTKRKYRVHDVVLPEQLTNSLPKVQQTLYLYVIDVEPVFQPTDEDTTAFHKLLASNRNYGILISKPLPKMGKMKFFQSYGSLRCAIRSTPVQLQIDSNEEMTKLKQFNFMLFNDLLDIVKTFFSYDLTNSYLIVPTRDDKICWDIVNEFQQLTPVDLQSEADRRSMHFVEDDWIYRVVCPWYRTDYKSRYVVTRLRTDLTPLSDFPNTAFPNYAAYVAEKYSTNVVNGDQFLIQVKGITLSLNHIHPGEGEDGRRKATTRGPEYLIPELCHNFHYPADLWLKATYLPSILHRLTYLLHAENMRIKLNGALGLNVVNYEPDDVIQHMPKVPIVHEEKPPITNAIVFPRPGAMEPRKLLPRDITPLSESINVPWSEAIEPIDLERNFDHVHSFEIDYYCEFISGKMMDLKIGKQGEDKMPQLVRTMPNGMPALCDAPTPDKLKIHILDIPYETNENVRGLEQSRLLAAITTAPSNDLFDMERYEVLGDAFLKFGISLYLLQNHINWHEGYLTSIKGAIVSNRNLCYNAIALKLAGILKVHDFSPKDDWLPPMFTVPELVQKCLRELQGSPRLLYKVDLSDAERKLGEASTEKLEELLLRITSDRPNSIDPTLERSPMLNFIGQQTVSDKTLADSVEAILGCCVEAAGIDRSFRILKAFNILPSNINVDLTQMLNVKLRSPRIRTNISDTEVDSFLINYKQLEQSIGYNFADRAYLLQALTHPSFPTNRVTGCYQQLEFLGDAVLDFLITSYIYERCPTMDEGTLTDLRSSLVNNVTLACLCVRYNIHKHILSQNAALSESIGNFYKYQCQNKHEVSEHVHLLLEEDDVTKNDELADKIAEYIDVPKTLGDVFEAIIGGIFLDSGNNLNVTWSIIYRLMQRELDRFMANVPIQIVRKLHEFPNANPQFDDPHVEEDTVMVTLTFTCNGEIRSVHGFGTNKDNAKRAAAKLALIKLQM